MEIQTIKPFLHYLGNVRERTMRWPAASRPTSWTGPTLREKFTLAILLRHLAVTERFMWEKRAGKTQPVQEPWQELADGFENVLALMERLHKESFGNLLAPHRP